MVYFSKDVLNTVGQILENGQKSCKQCGQPLTKCECDLEEGNEPDINDEPGENESGFGDDGSNEENEGESDDEDDVEELGVNGDPIKEPTKKKEEIIINPPIQFAMRGILRA